MTSLNGNGISISLLRLADKRMLQYLDGETRTLGSPSSMHFRKWYQERKVEDQDMDMDYKNSSSIYNKSGLSSMLTLCEPGLCPWLIKGC